MCTYILIRVYGLPGKFTLVSMRFARVESIEVLLLKGYATNVNLPKIQYIFSVFLQRSTSGHDPPAI